MKITLSSNVRKTEVGTSDRVVFTIVFMGLCAREKRRKRKKRERERLARKLGMRTNDVCIYTRKKNVWEREKTKWKGWCRWEWCDSWKKERMQIGLSSKMQAILAFACVRKREREREREGKPDLRIAFERKEGENYTVVCLMQGRWKQTTFIFTTLCRRWERERN